MGDFECLGLAEAAAAKTNPVEVSSNQILLWSLIPVVCTSRSRYIRERAPAQNRNNLQAVLFKNLSNPMSPRFATSPPQYPNI